MSAHISEITATSILRKQKKIDSWFISRYGMNLYRGCSHNCAYCDGRAEQYQVDGDFGKDVAVKINAVDVLQRELDPGRKRKPMRPGFIMVGGGVCDSYQPAERTYQLTRRALELIARHDFPVHMLTKSTLIERDLEWLKRIHEKKRAVISMSFSSVDDTISAVFEPGVPRPSRRLKTLEKFKKNGFPVGMYVMPVIPFITDTPKKIQETVQAAVDIGIDFIIFGGMTMKGGRQYEYFLRILRGYNAELVHSYEHIYSDDRWGQASSDYYDSIHAVFQIIAQACNIPVRMPPKIWADMVDVSDRVLIILEHIDYLLKLKGQKSPYGFAAYSLSQTKEPIEHIAALEAVRGVGKTTANLIREIIRTGTSTYYEWLLLGKRPAQ